MDTCRVLPILVLCVTLCAALTACSPSPTATPALPTATAVPTPVPAPTPTPRSLTVCMGQEPDTLYIYGGSMLAAGHVQQAVYDGPIDNRSYSHQPVILEKLPSLADGDAVIQQVTVKRGDTVVDTWDVPFRLDYDPAYPDLAVKIRPAGCCDDGCAVEYRGGELEMDQMVVTFTLRAGVTWADGTPVSAYDSEYSYDLYRDPDSPTSSHYWRTASYTATDARTVVWKGYPGYRDSAYFANFWQPLPQHQLGHLTAADVCCRSEEGSRILLGYGPFTVKEWIAGDHITVVRNPYYFRAEEGLPYFDQVVFRFIGEDPEHALAALLAGECDILTQDTGVYEVAEQLIALEQKGLVQLSFVPGTAWERLDFGIDPVADYERPDFSADVRMRRAIAVCLDRQAVIDELLYGRSIIPASYVPPVHPLYPHGLEPIPYDPAAAQALLEEIGWIDTDGDGLREARGVEGIPDGTPLAFKWQSTTAPLRVAYTQIFQQHLLECGIQVTLDNLPAGQFFADGPEGPLFGRHFDLASFTWLTSVEPPCGLYLCSQIPTETNGWAGQNETGYCSAAFDAACQAARQLLPGQPGYDDFHREAQRIYAQDIPSLPLYMRIKIAACRPEISGFILDPTAYSEMWNIEEFARR